jgi:phospholipid-binding lipoprotein MlaA
MNMNMNTIIRKKMRFFLTCCFLSFFSLIFSTFVFAQEADITKDPYEGFNRVVYRFNDTLDRFVLKPIATGYNAIMPKPLNQGIHNVFLNLNNIPIIVNDFLQAEFYQATSDLWRLGINTTIGIGGLFDVASRMQLKQNTNDFGLTLAKWGYRNSNYLVLPFLGPSTVRDGIGIPVDYFAFSVYPYIHPDQTRYEIYALSVVDRRAQALQYQEIFEEAAYDKYVFIRNAYLQRRVYLMTRKKEQKTNMSEQADSASI